MCSMWVRVEGQWHVVLVQGPENSELGLIKIGSDVQYITKKRWEAEGPWVKDQTYVFFFSMGSSIELCALVYLVQWLLAYLWNPRM